MQNVVFCHSISPAQRQCSKSIPLYNKSCTIGDKPTALGNLSKRQSALAHPYDPQWTRNIYTTTTSPFNLPSCNHNTDSLFRQEQCTAEEFSIGGTAHQVHQGLAQAIQQSQHKGVCRPTAPATRQLPASASQHTNIKTCPATTTQGHHSLRRPLPRQTYVVLPSTLQPSNHQHLSRRTSLPCIGGFSTVTSLRRPFGRHRQATRLPVGVPTVGLHSPSIHSPKTQKKHFGEDARLLRSLTPWAQNFGRPWQTSYN